MYKPSWWTEHSVTNQYVVFLLYHLLPVAVITCVVYIHWRITCETSVLRMLQMPGFWCFTCTTDCCIVVFYISCRISSCCNFVAVFICGQHYADRNSVCLSIFWIAEVFSESLIMAPVDSLYMILDITDGLFRRQLKGHPFWEAWTLWRCVTLIYGALEEHLLTYLLIATTSQSCTVSKLLTLVASVMWPWPWPLWA